MSSSYSFQTANPIREKVNVSSPGLSGLTTAGTATTTTAFHPVCSWTKRQLENSAESIVDFDIRLSYSAVTGTVGNLVITNTELPAPKYTDAIFMDVDQVGLSMTAGSVVRARLIPGATATATTYSGITYTSGVGPLEPVVALEQVASSTGVGTAITTTPAGAVTININGTYLSK